MIAVEERRTQTGARTLGTDAREDARGGSVAPEPKRVAPEDSVCASEAVYDETRRIGVWSDYFAHLLLDPIDVPGSAYVTLLSERTRHLMRFCALDHASLGAWCDRVESAPLQGVDLTEEQRQLAVDRTRLFRGIDASGPLPPYASYYGDSETASDESRARSVSACYRAAGVRFDGAVERDDYLGTEFAFLAHRATAELQALDQGDAVAAAAANEQISSFASRHLLPLVDRFCAAALPHARTPYFKAALDLLVRHNATMLHASRR